MAECAIINTESPLIQPVTLGNGWKFSLHDFILCTSRNGYSNVSKSRVNATVQRLRDVAVNENGHAPYHGMIMHTQELPKDQQRQQKARMAHAKK